MFEVWVVIGVCFLTVFLIMFFLPDGSLDKMHTYVPEEPESEEESTKSEEKGTSVSEPTLALVKAIKAEIVPKEEWVWYMEGMSLEELRSFLNYIKKGKVVVSDRFSKEDTIFYNNHIGKVIDYSLKDTLGNVLLFREDWSLTYGRGGRSLFIDLESIFTYKEAGMICNAYKSLYESKEVVIAVVRDKIEEIEVEQKKVLAKEKREKLMKDYCGGRQ